MATEIGAATLQINVTETLTLNGQSWGNEANIEITGIQRAYKRIYELAYRSAVDSAGEIEIINFRGSGEAGQINKNDVAFFRLWNRDDSRNMLIYADQFGDTSKNFSFSLGPGRMWYWFDPRFTTHAGPSNWEVSHTLGFFNDIRAALDVNVDEANVPGHLEVFIALTQV